MSRACTQNGRSAFKIAGVKLQEEDLLGDLGLLERKILGWILKKWVSLLKFGLIPLMIATKSNISVFLSLLWTSSYIALSCLYLHLPLSYLAVHYDICSIIYINIKGKPGKVK